MSKIFHEEDPIGKPLLLGNHTFPGVWRYMLPKEFLGLQFPEERRATCMSCPKASYEGYRPDYRCCTYHPRIPNFLLGLAAQTEKGLERLKSIIDQGMITPEGMNSTPKQWVNYLDDLEHDRFGKSEKVLCPMLEKETGFCTVHAFRNSVCSTFFCLKDHGGKSENFWTAVQTMGSQAEMAIAQWAMDQLGFDVAQYVKRLNGLAKKISKTSSKDEHGWHEDALDVLWGDWRGQELEFFEACGKLVSDHRDFLWQIANDTEIFEASKFDRAMVKSVPKELEEQVDPTDLDEDGETIAPEELWDVTLKAYRKIWKAPAGVFKLHKKIELMENPRQDEMEKTYPDKDYVIARIKGKNVDWRLFITADQYEVLKTFKDERLVSWKLLSSPSFRRLKSPQEFILEMIAQKILVRA
ncbi:hypothetical protein [Pseudobacteriovorax antillogorgiicola]|uniref:Uncharacterized protein n=1 Tax=Pseudobacteriovorax antillogorgiicola TaxID=1513793 RepID=A0A1Y6BBZ2_9BACT|nr:hypothetical protein [Pseudobacteriovorax antillogorgiicola]TCS58672.1 hypothetical protein EDD56_102185 [Pseudobacteriovorax antillogorgiicola]SME96070.1 hypothetical protein SAMN06296036_102258 [Pseudobacteriovorax antillogorgiicola]